ncbi:MAG TPA: endospore germination permease [Candidatus Atribacteria bacterium]|nr:endospore germination permease [Candidatus Atribacteria bacterium]
MLASADKISARQAIIIFLTAQCSPIIRIVPRDVSRIAGRAGWLAPLFSMLPFICLVYIMHLLFKKQKDASLGELYIKVFGKVIGRVILAFFLVWFLILTGLYVRYFAERFLSALLPNTAPVFFYVTMLATVFYAVRGGIVNLARTVEYLFYLFTVIFVVLFVLCIPNVQSINLLPVAQYDIIPLIKTIKPIFGIWGYFSLVFFFGDEINDKEHIRRFGLQGALYLLMTCVMLLIQTIGVYGHTVIQRIPLPYIVAIKSISLLDTIERIESIALAFWVFIDFTVISLFAYVVISVLKSICSLTEGKNFVSPIVLFALIFAFFLANDRLELGQFSEHIGLPVNIIVCFVMPAVLLVVGKLRKII